ncbi:MAG: cytidine deaminase [Pseudomonadota bacterium]
MEKQELSPSDHALVAAAAEAVKKPVSQLFGGRAPPLVGAAVGLAGGGIITSGNLIADVGCLSVCAEPIAIAEAVKQPDKKIETIVAVYHMPGRDPCVVSPCGQCREIIADYAPECSVILREPGTTDLFKVKASDLLPLRYAEYWQDGRLV